MHDNSTKTREAHLAKQYSEDDGTVTATLHYTENIGSYALNSLFLLKNKTKDKHVHVKTAQLGKESEYFNNP